MTYHEDAAVVAAREAVAPAAQDWALYFEAASGDWAKTFEEREADFNAALAAYGDAVALAVRRETHQHEWVRPTSTNAMYETACRCTVCTAHQCGRCGEPYRIEGRAHG